MVMFFNDEAKIRKRQNREMKENNGSVDLRIDLVLSPGEFPVPDLAVDWPERRILCSVTMLLGHSDLRRFGSLDFGTKHPDLLDLDAGIVEVAADSILGRGLL